MHLCRDDVLKIIADIAGSMQGDQLSLQMRQQFVLWYLRQLRMNACERTHTKDIN
jgi:hypothetical protein